jgi:hypothetical protein
VLLSTPRVLLSVLRFAGEKGAPYLFDKVAFHPSLIDGARDSELQQILKRLHWFLFEVLGLDIDHNIAWGLHRELRLPALLSSKETLHRWTTDDWHSILPEMIELFKEAPALEEKLEAKKDLFRFVGGWVYERWDGVFDAKVSDLSGQGEWRQWLYAKSQMRNLLFSMEITADEDVIFAVRENNASPHLGESKESPIQALINANVLMAETNFDDWLDANIDPGTEPNDTRVYQALGTDPPCLWRNKQFLDYVESLESQ